jgi:hypothetical protein
MIIKKKAYSRLSSQLSMCYSPHGKGKGRRGGRKHRARTRARTSRTKRRGGRNLLKVTFSDSNYKRKT